jgi:hypothetical protein
LHFKDPWPLLNSASPDTRLAGVSPQERVVFATTLSH